MVTVCWLAVGGHSVGRPFSRSVGLLIRRWPRGQSFYLSVRLQIGQPSVDRWVDQSLGGPVSRLVSGSAAQSQGRLLGRSLGQLVNDAGDRQSAWLVCRVIDRSVGFSWSASWSVGRFNHSIGRSISDGRWSLDQTSRPVGQSVSCSWLVGWTVDLSFCRSSILSVGRSHDQSAGLAVGHSLCRLVSRLVS